MDWSAGGSTDLLPVNHKINKGELLFEKIEDEVVEKQIAKLESTKKENEVSEPTNQLPPIKDEITYDDFMKLDLRTGTILSAEPVPKSNKLLKFNVDIGTEQRTILSGVAKFFDPENMIGKKVVVLANLAPRKMMGIESQGMLLFAENADGALQAVSPSDQADSGSTIS